MINTGSFGSPFYYGDKMKGAISYTGNKESLLPKLLELFPTDYTRFVDAFCGGLSVSLNVPGNVLANDIQPQLIDMYTKMRELSTEALVAFIDEHKVSKDDQAGYYALRDLYNQTKDPLLLLVLHYSSFSNMIRFSNEGEFNAPFGKRQFNKNSLRKLLGFKESCDKISFSNKSYIDLDIQDGDFVYADTPYLITEAVYNKFWSEQEEVKFLGWLDTLNSRGIKFGLSNVVDHHGKTNHILKDWMGAYTVHELQKNYVFNAYHTKEKGGTREVYITNC